MHGRLDAWRAGWAISGGARACAGWLVIEPLYVRWDWMHGGAGGMPSGGAMEGWWRAEWSVDIVVTVSVGMCVLCVKMHYNFC